MNLSMREKKRRRAYVVLVTWVMEWSVGLYLLSLHKFWLKIMFLLKH